MAVPWQHATVLGPRKEQGLSILAEQGVPMGMLMLLVMYCRTAGFGSKPTRPYRLSRKGLAEAFCSGKAEAPRQMLCLADADPWAHK